MRQPRILTLTVPLTAALLAGCQEGNSPADALVARSGGLTAPSIEGKFEARIASMDDGTSRISYHVRTPDGVKDLVTDEPIELKYETYVRAWGEPEGDDDFVLDELEVLAPPPTPLIDPEPYPYRRIATVLVFWNQPGLTNATAKEDMFISFDSTNVFYGENSYGKETIAGDVFGPYQIDDPGACNPNFIADQGLQQFIEKGHDPDEFRQFMWHFPGLGDCGFGGLATLGSVEAPARDSWYNGNFGCVVRAQEIGHNYGMGHSHSWDCPNGTIVPLGDECEHVEYGDPFDPMGGGCDHMNVTQKGYMGWLEECNIVTTEASGTFNVVPTELPCDGTQALRFPSYDENRYYYIEYRQNYGVDAGFDSVLLHWSSGHEYSPSPYIIEAGTDENGDSQYEMQIGDTFTDPMGTVSFTVTDMLPTHAVIDVTFPDGGSGEPTCDGGGLPAMAAGAVGSLDCAAEPFPLDETPPTVEITYPADGDVFPVGADFTITAEAMDDRYVTEAELYLQIIGTDDQPQPLFKLFDPPYEYDVTNIPEGEYLFGFVVRDGPNQGISAPVTIQVTNDIPADTSGGESADGSSTTDTPDPTDASAEGTGDGSSESTGPGIDSETSGCECSAEGNRGGAGFGLLGLGLGVIVRRRRRGAN
jgi:MYXO-CTERM domain-containing protein